MEYDYVEYRVQDNLPDVIINWNPIPEENDQELAQNQDKQADYHKLTLWILALITIALLGVFLYALPILKPSQNCQCMISNGFPKKDKTVGLIDSSTVVPCTLGGAKECRSICTSLAKNLTVPMHGKSLCNVDENQKKYQGSLFYRPCVELVWRPTYLKVEVCCLNGDACYC